MPSEKYDDAAIAALLALAKWNIPTDTQELLVSGNPMNNVPPGALSAAMKAALSATAQPAEAGVTVKELEWSHFDQTLTGYEWYEADTIVGAYWISVQPAGFIANRPKSQKPIGTFPTLEAAKAAAQADYEARIRSALHPTPQPAPSITTPWGWVCSGEGDGWKETDKLVRDPELVDRYRGNPNWHTIVPLYPQPAPSSADAGMLAALDDFIMSGENCSGPINGIHLKHLREWRIAIAAAEATRTKGVEGWQTMDSALRDGTEILLLHRVHGVIEGRFSQGEWSEENPVTPREYSGSVWVLGDDIDQEEVEETPYGFLDGSILGWLPRNALPAAPKQGGE